MKNRGWYGEHYRHSLSAKGISTRRSFAVPMLVEDAGMYSGGNEVKNYLKGRDKKENPKFIDPETGEVKDLFKSLQARGIRTTGGREFKKVGAVSKPDMGPLFPGYGRESPTPAFDLGSLGALPEQQQSLDLLNYPMGTEDVMPTTSASYGLEQQAQRVEGGPSALSLGSVPLISEEAKETPKGFVQVPIVTADTFEPIPFDEERH